MASTATALLGFEKQGTGDNNNSWGAKLNTSGLDIIDAAIAGMASYTLSGSKTLTSTNYADNEARKPFQNITGGTGGTITVPSLAGRYFFRNASSGAVVVTTGSGVTASLTAGDAGWVFCDGTNVYTSVLKSYVDNAITEAAFGGITLADGMQAFLQTPTSANFYGTLTTKTGTGGSVVFSVSPAFTGTPSAPTATTGTNTTQLATTEFVAAAIAAVGAVTASSVTTFTNKNLSLANNSVVGTKAQFNTALSDGDFAYASDLTGYPTNNGTGATGTWAISISGTAATATYVTGGQADITTPGAGSNALRIRGAGGGVDLTGQQWTNSTGVTQWAAETVNASGLRTYTGSFTVGGVLTQTSDERFKKNWRGLREDLLERLVEMKRGVFDRTDVELAQVGVSAQDLRKVVPEAVVEAQDGRLSVDYGAVALVSVLELMEQFLDLRADVRARP